MSLLPPMSSPTSSWTRGKHAVETVLDPPVRATILVAAVAFHGLLLMGLSSRGRRSGHPMLRSFLWIASALYLPLMSYVLSYLTSNIWLSLPDPDRVWLLISVVLIQFLKARADLAALAVAASASPAAGDDDMNSLKVRPSAETLIYSFWVAGLVVYNVIAKDNGKLGYMILLIMPLWILGACRMVLSFVAFQRATSSFALGRNVKLINGYIMQLQEAEGQLPAAGVPRLIVTGERNQDVEESPSGYRVKSSSLQDKESKLITLDRVWSESDSRLLPEHKDICLSFAMFKCLRRQFAGHRLTEAGSIWALRFIQDGLLGQKDDHERIFRA